MADASIVGSPLSGGVRETEALFSRNEDDQLIVREKATRDRFKERVKLSIDGYEMEIERAVPWTDFLGNVETDLDGLPKPRATTIYDAAKKLGEDLVKQGVWDREELGRRIPILCHRDHLEPVAVCRMCSVHVSKKRRRDGRIMPSPKLVPACHHEVQADMVVTTRAGWGGYSPEEKRKMTAESAALKELQASVPEEGNGTDSAEWLRRARKVLRVTPKNDRDDFLRRVTTRIQKIDEQPAKAELADEKALLDDLKATAPKDDAADAFEPWLDRVRQALRIDQKKELLRKVDDRLKSIGDVERAIVEYGDQTHASVCLLGELLLADHCPPEPVRPLEPKRFDNELRVVCQSLGVETARKDFLPRSGSVVSRNVVQHTKSRPLPVLPPTQQSLEPFPYSSRSIQVDHDRCILCDRCARSCSEVKPFKVIGHTGKGYQTRISFDLDQIMNESSCVQCGECMSACPTGALTLNRRVVPKPVWEALEITDANDPRLKKLADPSQPLPAEFNFLTAEEMLRVRLPFIDENGSTRDFYPFDGIPYSFLRWNEGAVRRRQFTSGDVLCVQGEFGSTAFLLEKGEIEVRVGGLQDHEKRGFWSKLLPGRDRGVGKKVETLHANKDLIVGEMACLSNAARTASLVAAGDVTVLEVTRNMLHMLQRAPAARDILNRVYRRRAVDSCLRRGKLFANLTDEERNRIIPELTRVAEWRRAAPGEVIVAEGAREGDFYIVRLGFVKVASHRGGQETVLARLSANDYFGEIALMGYHPQVQSAAREAGVDPHVRTATCSALDDLEIVSIPGDAFQAVVRQHPSIERPLVERCIAMLKERRTPPPPQLADFLNQGLFQSQKMLVLDLLSCTRCDECTRACADAHGDGHSRLLREGLRFGNFLVAASCRSCHQPFCMDGCPVDAIHRDAKSLEVLIDSHCIGCSLCERNCPYGSIQMVPKQSGFRWKDLLEDVNGERQLMASVERRAVNCDLCHDLVNPGREPFCVSACPHGAAFRWDGEKLLDTVIKRG